MQKVTRRQRPRLQGVALVVALLQLLSLSACTTTWPRGPVPGVERPFPNLASVPPKPTGFPPTFERQAQLDALALDRAAAAPLGAAPAGTEGKEAPVPLAKGGGKLPAIDARAVAAGGWISADLRDAPSGTLVGMVFFDNGSAELTPKGRDVLRAVASVQRKRGGVLRLVGHASAPTNAADAAHAAEVNRHMVLARVAAAAAELRRLGLQDDQIETASEGAEAPAYDEAAPFGEAANRRVEVFLEL